MSLEYPLVACIIRGSLTFMFNPGEILQNFNMPGGRARSARSDISDSDDAVGEKELELVRLQRQQRIMEKDRKAYVQESKDRIMAQR